MMMMVVIAGTSLPVVERDQLHAVLRRLAVRDGSRWTGDRLCWRYRLPGDGGPADRHAVLHVDDRRQQLWPADGPRWQQCRLGRPAD